MLAHEAIGRWTRHWYRKAGNGEHIYFIREIVIHWPMKYFSHQVGKRLLLKAHIYKTAWPCYLWGEHSHIYGRVYLTHKTQTTSILQNENGETGHTFLVSSLRPSTNSVCVEGIWTLRSSLSKWLDWRLPIPAPTILSSSLELSCWGNKWEHTLSENQPQSIYMLFH